MFAIITIGGKQHRVGVGDKISVEHIDGKVGDKVKLDHVLLVSADKSTKIGAPTVKGAVVTAKILAQEKGEKLEIRRYKSKVRYRRHRGFRSHLTALEIVSIE